MDGLKLRVLVKAVIFSYIITGALLLLTAFLLYTLEPEKSMVSVGILVIYVLSCLLGGVAAGRGIKSRKFFWGMATGIVYFVLLLLASAVTGGIHATAVQIATTFALCIAGGMLGGMIA